MVLKRSLGVRLYALAILYVLSVVSTLTSRLTYVAGTIAYKAALYRTNCELNTRAERPAHLARGSGKMLRALRYVAGYAAPPVTVLYFTESRDASCGPAQADAMYISSYHGSRTKYTGIFIYCTRFIYTGLYIQVVYKYKCTATGRTAVLICAYKIINRLSARLFHRHTIYIDIQLVHVT